MANNEETLELEDSNEDSQGNVKLRLKERSKKMAETKEMTKQMLSKHAVKIAKQAEEHEILINKVTYLVGVLSFGGFCFILGARPQDVRYLYCLFYITFVPLRWIYYRYKKWHYYLLDFCYYANTIFLIMLLFYPRNEKLFMVCFSFAEGPLAWALIVWRNSLVFNSMDKLVSVCIHLLPGIVFFTIRWWDPVYYEAMHLDRAVQSKSYLWTWLFFVPLVAYFIWQVLYYLIVNVLRKQRLLRDPQVMTSYRELSKKAQKANNIWWRISGMLGDQNRLLMYILLQAMFTVATTALAVPIFLSYELHAVFQLLKVSAAVWNGGNFLLEVMPKRVILKEKKKMAIDPIQDRLKDENLKEEDESSEAMEI